MALATWRPDVAVQVAFNADPNDPNAVPSWTDLTTTFRSASAVKRGRQYELDQNQASAPTLSFLDKDEYLNPANTTSPYSPNVVPYRQLLWQAMYPNGGTGNLLNTGYGTNPQLNTTAGYDPSFESYTAGASVPWILTTGAVTPTVSTSNPFQGTKDLQYTVSSSGGEQGVGLVIPCIPGRQYTSSLYVRQTAGNTTAIFINGGAGGTTTTTTGSYVRLTVTWTATQPTHQLWVASITTGSSGTVNVDAIQHEPGASVSAFTTSGPVIYGVFRGYVERWPSRWDYAGFLGEAAVTAVDSFGPQNLIGLGTEYRNAVLATEPAYYWPLAEPDGAATFAESSGNQGPPLHRRDGPFGSGTITAGTQNNIPGDAGGTGVEVGPSQGIPVVNGAWSNLQTGQYGQPQISIPVNGYPFGLTLAFWLSHAVAAEDGANLAVTNTVPGSPISPAVQFTGDANGGSLSFPNGGLVATSFTDNTHDGNPHLYIHTETFTSTTSTFTSYVDGVQVAQDVQATGGLNPTFTLNIVQVAGVITIFSGSTVLNSNSGIYSNVALWARALSAAEVANLWAAGRGYPGETSGVRVARNLGYGGITQTSIDTGQSIMGVSDLAAGTTLLNANQDVTTTENGDYWVDQDGNTTFAARTRRYLATTSQYTFGERTDLGEYPYQGDIGFDFDPTLIYNAVEVDNSGGVTAIATGAASQLRYYPRTYQRGINVQDNNEAFDAANYLLGQHQDPHLRVAQVTLDPVAYPALWAVVLSLRIGMRITVKRRAKAANVGVGITISADFFVESISHDTVDMRTAQWTVTLYLSPVDINQVGILDSSTFGRLGMDGAALHASITSSATTATVDSTSGGCVFTTTTGVPFAATIGSEIVTVTGVANGAQDAFGRTVSSGWGTADIGGAWTTSGGSASDYSVGSSLGKHTITTTGVRRLTVLGTGITYVESTWNTQVSAVATGAMITAGAVIRYVDSSNYYRYEVRFQTNGTVDIAIQKIVAGTTTLIGSYTGIITSYTAATVINARCQAIGSTLRLRVWMGATEPLGQWHVTVTDTTFTTGSVGFLSIASAGNTNTNPVVAFGTFVLANPQTFTVARPTDGTAAAHSAGASVVPTSALVLAY